MQNSRRIRATEFDADATASKDWNCGKSDPGRVLTCTDDAVPSLTTPQFVTEEVTVVAGPSWTKNSMMTFCGTLTGAVDTFDNFHGDNEDCKSVILDPFNVKVAKTGDQSCAPGGDCHFTINLFNPGPIDHNAPVTISDHLKGLSSAHILSIKPPLPCASQPTHILVHIARQRVPHFGCARWRQVWAARLRDGRAPAERHERKAILQLRERDRGREDEKRR